MADPTLNVVVKANASQAESALKNLEGKGVVSSNAIAAGFAKAQVAVDTIKSTARAVGTVLADIAKRGTDAAETMSLLNVTFGDDRKAIHAWAKDSSAAITQTVLDVENQTATYFNMIKATGLAKDASLELAKGFVNLAADIGSFKNVEPDEMFTKMQSAISGEFMPLRELGVLLNESTLKQAAYNAGIAKHGEALTFAQKAQTVYLEIQRQMPEALGDVERTQFGVANSARNLRARWDEVKTQAGLLLMDNKALGETLGFVAGMVQDLIGKLQDWMENNPKLAEQLRGDLANGVLTAVQVVDLLATGLMELGVGFAYVAAAAQVAYYWFTQNNEAMTRAQAQMGNYASMLTDISHGFQDRQQLYSDFRAQINNPGSPTEQRVEVGRRVISGVLNVRVVGGDPLSVADALVG